MTKSRKVSKPNPNAVIPVKIGIQHHSETSTTSPKEPSMTQKQPCVYLLTSQRNGTLYTGVTSNLVQRVWQHREGIVAGFSKRYAVKLLVWYELHGSMETAIIREKKIKEWRRKWKLDLIEKENPPSSKPRRHSNHVVTLPTPSFR